MDKKEIKKIQKAADKYFESINSVIDEMIRLRMSMEVISNPKEKARVVAEFNVMNQRLKDMAKKTDNFFDLIGAEKK